MLTPRAVTDQPLEVELLTGRERFRALRSEWNELVEEVADQPFYRHDYLQSWLASFAGDAELRLLAARDAEGRLAAVLPLIDRPATVLHLPVREWSSPTDVHSFRFDLIARDPAEAAHAFLWRLRSEPGWDLLRLTDVPAGGAAWRIYDGARAAGFPGGVYLSQRSPYLALPASMDELRTAWSSKWRSNLHRRRRILERRGAVTFRRFVGGPELERQLNQCFDLERRESDSGRPATIEPRIRSFFVSVATRASAEGTFSLDLLELDGRPIAFHYGLTRAGVYSLALTGHDAALRDGAPGHLLTEHVLETSIAAGLRELDFLGCDLEWKRAWTQATRDHSWLYLFRPTPAGALLARAKFHWAPAVRRWLRPRSPVEGRTS